MLNRIILIGFAIAVFLGVPACGDTVPPELKQGIQVVRYMSAKNQLMRSSFLVVFPKGRPSDFVSWMFSTFGSAEFPDSEEYAEKDPLVAEQARAIGVPLIPKGVSLIPLSPNLNQKKQVVVKFDNPRGVLIAEGYLDPAKPPVIVSEWELPSIN